MARALNRLTNLFPLWVSLGAALALIHPGWFTWFKGQAIVWGLAVIMLGMGLTLSLEDFRSVARMPKVAALGFLAQYTIMPLLGWSLAALLRLPEPFAVGLILVACCPGGTASNVVTHIAGANVALSVLMTMCSTFGAVGMTPLLTGWLVGTRVAVDQWGLFVSTVQVVLVPVVLGVVLHHGFPGAIRRVAVVSPLLSVVVIVLICSSVIGENADAVRASGGRLAVAVFLLHAGGFALGYALAKCAGFDRRVCQTVSIEVGMQNSGLGVVLAKKHFASALTPVPCAISATFHSIIGSACAAWWRNRCEQSQTRAKQRGKV